MEVDDPHSKYMQKFYLDSVALAGLPNAKIKFMENKAVVKKLEEQVKIIKSWKFDSPVLM